MADAVLMVQACETVADTGMFVGVEAESAGSAIPVAANNAAATDSLNADLVNMLLLLVIAVTIVAL
jgi:hypothetical protein